MKVTGTLSIGNDNCAMPSHFATFGASVTSSGIVVVRGCARADFVGPMYSTGAIVVMPTGNLALRGDETHRWIGDTSREYHVVNLGTIETVRDAHLVVDGKGINCGEFDVGGMVQFGGSKPAALAFSHDAKLLPALIPQFALDDLANVASEGGLSIFATGSLTGNAILGGDVVNKGKIDPGLPGSMGTIEIIGDLISEGAIAIDIIRSTGRFPDHDIVDVIGQVVISGEVRVTFDRGYVPDAALRGGLVRASRDKLTADSSTKYDVFTDNPIVDFKVLHTIKTCQCNHNRGPCSFCNLPLLQHHLPLFLCHWRYIECRTNGIGSAVAGDLVYLTAYEG